MVKFYFQGFHPDIKENRVQFYEDWNEFVQHKIPKERLLIFNAKQGWGPLCEFLGKPIPDGPYPRAPNVSKTMRKSIHFKNAVTELTPETDFEIEHLRWNDF